MRRGRAGSGCLCCGVEQALGRQLLLELLEAAPQRAFAGLLEVLDHHLEVAARLVQADPAAGQHLRAVLDREAHQQVALAEHRAAHLGAASLSEKYQWPEPGRDRLEISPSSQTEPEAALEQRAGLAVEAADGEDVAGGEASVAGGGGVEPGILHGGGSLADSGTRRRGPGAFPGVAAARYNCALPFTSPDQPMLRILEEALTFDDVLLVPAVFAGAAARGRPRHPADARHPARTCRWSPPPWTPSPSPPRDRHGAGRRHRHHPQEHDRRGAGARGGAGQEVRERHHPRPDHRHARDDDPRGARADARAATSPACRSCATARLVGIVTAPRPALRDPLRRAGVRRDDAAGAAGHGARGRAARKRCSACCTSTASRRCWWSTTTSSSRA